MRQLLEHIQNHLQNAYRKPYIESMQNKYTQTGKTFHGKQIELISDNMYNNVEKTYRRTRTYTNVQNAYKQL